MDIRKVRMKDFINPAKWAAVAESYTKKFKGISLEFCEEVDLLFFTEPDTAHNLALSKGVSVDYCRMVVYRASKCSDCVENGSCFHCGCSCPDNMLARVNSCSAGKWPAFHTDNDFKNYIENESREITGSSKRV